MSDRNRFSIQYRNQLNECCTYRPLAASLEEAWQIARRMCNPLSGWELVNVLDRQQTKEDQ